MKENMSCKDRIYPFKMFLGDVPENVVFDSKDFKRILHVWDDECSQLVDVHSKCGMTVHYLRISTDGEPKEVCFSGVGVISKIFNVSELGTILYVIYESNHYSVWLPRAFCLFRLDDSQRLSMLDSSNCAYQWEFGSSASLRLSLSGNTRGSAVIPYIVVRDPYGELVRDLTALQQVEKRLYRKSDWFFAERPGDIWSQLINGSLYDPRVHRGIEKRFKCQQCAYAWWNYFGFLFRQTRKPFYSMFQDEIAYSVLLDMSLSGEWGHGFWSDEIETHARFHLDGIHLLISQYDKTEDPLWLEAARKSLEFVLKNLAECLDDGSLWFLHDTIEDKIRRRVNSSLFGKTLGNSLCVNTHVQALTVLHRLCQRIPNESNYNKIFNQGLQALYRVLGHQPAQKIYKFLGVRLLAYKKRTSAYSIIGKLRNVLEGFIVPRAFWFVRRRFPRIVFPNGFIERDLTLGFFSDRYHITNLKDLLTLYQMTPIPWMRDYIKKGFEFISTFLENIDIRKAISSSPYYFEYMDILFLYNRLIEEIPPEILLGTEEAIFKETGGYSLDYYASDLVRNQKEN